MRARRNASAILVVLGVLCTMVALLLGYARTALLDSDQFADRATAALQEQPVRDLVARTVTDEVVLRAERDLVAVRPVIESAVGAVISSGAFESVFRAAVRDLHRTAFTNDRDTATLTLVDVGVLVSSTLRRLDPRAARGIGDLDVRLSAGAAGRDALDAARYADGISGLATLAAILAAVLLLGGVLLAVDRRRAVVQAGAGAAVGGALLLIAYGIARARATAAFPVPADHAAAGAIWDAFLRDLRTWALVLLGCGTVVAAAAASLLRPVSVEGPLTRAWRIVTTVPERPALRALRALAFVVAGIAIIAERAWVLDTAMILLGVFVLYHGVAEILRLLERPAGLQPAAGPAVAARPRRTAPLIATGLAAAVIALLVAGLFASGGTEAPARAAVTACNGSPDLCDRPLDEVVFPATHNSMSGATNANWLFPQQEKGIRGQLDDGVRGLMIDAYPGERVGDRVRTVLEGGKTKEQIVEELGRPAYDAAMRIRDRLLGSGGAEPRTEWLCHGFCELGATEMLEGLRQVRDFLVANPGEVLLVVIQDEGVTPAEVAASFESSGLRPYVYTGPAGAPWPTLREMIDGGGRVVVMAEHVAGGDEVPWYHPAYEGIMQETPFRFTRPSELVEPVARSCDPNRGDETGDFFLLNHWIDTSPAPRPSNAAKVNAYDVLMRRIDDCTQRRGLRPNVLAVDFYATGDVFRVADTLNRTPQGS